MDKKGVAITGGLLIVGLIVLLMVFSGSIVDIYNLTKTTGSVAGFLASIPIWVWVAVIFLIILKMGKDKK